MRHYPGGAPERVSRATRALAVWLAWAAVTVCAVPASAQEWLDRPVTFFDERMVVGGEAFVTLAPDDEGFFNYTDYDRSALRLVRLGVTASVKANDHLSLLAEIRAEGDTGQGEWTGEPYALFVRLRPWPTRPFEIQAGRVAPAFGGFLRRSYGRDNPLIGYPLAYQYLTSLRSNAIPRHADDLLERQGTGWYTGYPVGDPAWDNGVPLVSAFRYDTGVLARYGSASGTWEVLASLTTGTLSNPRVWDDNGSPQIAGRAVIRPIVGLVAGVSVAGGAFLADSLASSLPPGTNPSEYEQRTVGVDAEYSRDYWVLRGEWLRTSWQVPALAEPRINDPLGATAWSIEGRYTILPGLYAAARADRLAFSRIRGTSGIAPWDANVSRLETGIGYSVTRHVVVKTSYQYNRRDGGYVRRAHYGAAQLLVWF